MPDEKDSAPAKPNYRLDVELARKNLPFELGKTRRWTVWRYTWDDKKSRWAKPPYDLETGRRGDKNETAKYGFDEVMAAAANCGFSGVGFLPLYPFIYVDLDHCILPNGELTPLARSVVDLCNSYTEKSPSGDGLKIWIQGDAPKDKDSMFSRKVSQGAGQFEIYPRDQYSTFTGQLWPGSSTEVRWLDAREMAVLYALAEKKSEIVQAKRRGLTDDKRFELLMEGKLVEAGFENHPGDNRADLALCCIIARKFRTKNSKLIDKIFRSSGCYRSKWDDRHGHDTYGNITITEAIARVEIPEEIEVPEYVDLNAPATDADAAEIGAIPEQAMYGKARALAGVLDCPLSYAYPAILAVAAAYGFENVSNIRPTLYVALLGRVGAGKSVARHRSTALFSGLQIIDKTPGSDRGLYSIFESTSKPENAGQTFLLSLDEMRDVMAKIAIQGSSLSPVLCVLWNNNTAGSADKTGSHGVNLRLNILGCAKVDSPDEFPQIFSADTAHGFYDRCLFGVRAGSEKWRFNPWEHPPIDLNLDSNHAVSKPSVPASVYRLMHDWRERQKGRDRLGELALRVAYITSALNGDLTVTDEAVEHALRFMEWQEKIRAVYRPAKNAQDFAEFTDIVLEAFRKAPGKAANWGQLCHKGNWYRRWGRVIKQVRAMLESEQVIVYSKEHKKHFLNSKKEATENAD